MSQQTSPPDGPGHKTLAIRLDLPLHAQLSVIAQLRGSTITEEIRQALHVHVESVRSDPGLTAQADAVRLDIEREAQERREAIASLFGEPPPSAPAETPKTTTRRSRSSEG